MPTLQMRKGKISMWCQFGNVFTSTITITITISPTTPTTRQVTHSNLIRSIFVWGMLQFDTGMRLMVEWFTARLACTTCCIASIIVSGTFGFPHQRQNVLCAHTVTNHHPRLPVTKTTSTQPHLVHSVWQPAIVIYLAAQALLPAGCHVIRGSYCLQKLGRRTVDTSTAVGSDGVSLWPSETII